MKQIVKYRYLPDELLSAELSAGQMIAVSVHSISTIVLKYQFSAAQRWTKKHIHTYIVNCGIGSGTYSSSAAISGSR
jgi:hypothetical protein